MYGAGPGKKLFKAIRAHDQEAIAACLAQDPTVINIANASGCTLLHEAVLHNAPQAVAALLTANSDPNVMDRWQETPLHNVARNGNLELAKQLIAHGAASNLRNHHDLTPRELLQITAPGRVQEFMQIIAMAPKLY